MSKTTVMVAGVTAALLLSAGVQAQGPGGQGQGGQGAQGQQGGQPSGGGGDQNTKAPQRQEKSGDKGSSGSQAQKSNDAKSAPGQQKVDDGGRRQKADDTKSAPRQKNADDQGKSGSRQKADDQGKAPDRQQKADERTKERQKKADDRVRDRQQKADETKSQNRKQEKSADDKSAPKSDKTGTANQKSEQVGGNRNAGGKSDQPPTRRAELSTEQRTSVRQTIERAPSVNRVSNVRVNINVGTRVPRNVRLASLPAIVVSIVPAYRSYRYFVVEERIVIVDPSTYYIVEVIDGDGSGDRDGGARLVLTENERDLLLREIELDTSSTLGIGSLVIGADVPRAARVRSLPDRVVGEIPKLRSYRYFTAENRIVLVAPGEERVVFVIEGRR
jgi:Protein of unknown function (DUF1236)